SLLDDPRLRTGQRVRQLLVEAADEVAVHDVGDAGGTAFERALAQHERELQPEQLVEHEPAACFARLVHRLRTVDAVEGRGAIDEVEAIEHELRYRVDEAA